MTYQRFAALFGWLSMSPVVAQSYPTTQFDLPPGISVTAPVVSQTVHIGEPFRLKVAVRNDDSAPYDSVTVLVQSERRVADSWRAPNYDDVWSKLLAKHGMGIGGGRAGQTTFLPKQASVEFSSEIMDLWATSVAGEARVRVLVSVVRRHPGANAFVGGGHGYGGVVSPWCNIAVQGHEGNSALLEAVVRDRSGHSAAAFRSYMSARLDSSFGIALRLTVEGGLTDEVSPLAAVPMMVSRREASMAASLALVNLVKNGGVTEYTRDRILLGAALEWCRVAQAKGRRGGSVILGDVAMSCMNLESVTTDPRMKGYACMMQAGMNIILGNKQAANLDVGRAEGMRMEEPSSVAAIAYLRNKVAAMK